MLGDPIRKCWELLSTEITLEPCQLIGVSLLALCTALLIRQVTAMPQRTRRLSKNIYVYILPQIIMFLKRQWVVSETGVCPLQIRSTTYNLQFSNDFTSLVDYESTQLTQLRERWLPSRQWALLSFQYDFPWELWVPSWLSISEIPKNKFLMAPLKIITAIL